MNKVVVSQPSRLVAENFAKNYNKAKQEAASGIKKLVAAAPAPPNSPKGTPSNLQDMRKFAAYKNIKNLPIKDSMHKLNITV